MTAKRIELYHLGLVLSQFILAAVIVLTAEWWPVPWATLLIAAPGIVLAVWAWMTMGLLRLRIHPSVTEKTRLVQSGPYGIVRHPMYSGLLWFTAAIVVADATWWRVGLWSALFAVLVAKASEEEKSLVAFFGQYERYRERVGMLVPKVKR